MPRKRQRQPQPSVTQRLEVEDSAETINSANTRNDKPVQTGDDMNAEAWSQANAAALQSSNAYVDRYGLPLDAYRVWPSNE